PSGGGGRDEGRLRESLTPRSWRDPSPPKGGEGAQAQCRALTEFVVIAQNDEATRSRPITWAMLRTCCFWSSFMLMISGKAADLSCCTWALAGWICASRDSLA